MKKKVLTLMFIFCTLHLIAQNDISSNTDTASSKNGKWNYGISFMISSTPKITGTDVISGETTMGKGLSILLLYSINDHFKISGGLKYFYAKQDFSIISYDPKNSDNSEIAPFKNYNDNLSIPVSIQYNTSKFKRFQLYGGMGVVCSLRQDANDWSYAIKNLQSTIALSPSAGTSIIYFPIYFEAGTKLYVGSNSSIFLSATLESPFKNYLINSYGARQGEVSLYSNLTIFFLNTGILF